MATTTVMEQIDQCINEKKNFLLSGGAGSGKTYTLIQTIDHVYKKYPVARVACITYTNVAANEVKERSPFSRLHVSTIHDFLWDAIKSFQKNIIDTVMILLDEDRKNTETDLSYSGETEICKENISTIEYRNYRKIETGIVSHDDVLKIAGYMFTRYSLLAKIFCDRFDFVFIDEYQDTQKIVIDIFLKHIKNHAKNRLCVGFFGDRMQSIYDTGVQNIDSYIEEGTVTEIPKTDNYRCSVSVINLINNIRTDSIQQKPANVANDGSIANKYGSALFVYSTKDFELDKFKAANIVPDWDFENPKITKILFLTHKLIAGRQGFENLIGAYRYNENLIGNEPDRFAKHLLKIGGILYYYRHKNYRLVIDGIDIKINSNGEKERISRFLSEISDYSDLTIEELIERFDKEKLVRKDDHFMEYLENQPELWENVKGLPFMQIISYFEFYNDYSPYCSAYDELAENRPS
jgi:DNA helicase-2/ATP-dependent DNA helicase PcrA